MTKVPLLSCIFVRCPGGYMSTENTGNTVEIIKDVEVVDSNGQSFMNSDLSSHNPRNTKFTEASFDDKNQMVYEKSNAFALSYYGISRNEQSLLLAGLVSVYNVNKANPYTESEIASGIQCHVPILHVAKMMGYDITDKKNKSFYRAVKTAAIRLTNSKSILKENEDKTGFSVFNVISQVDYNNNNDGRVTFKFSPGASELFLDNKRNFTLYSLILKNKMEQYGKNGAVRLHEVLRTDFYKAERSDKGFFQVYYDFIDFKCKLFLINTNNPTVKTILSNPRYSMDQIVSNDNLAYERALAIENLDTIVRENIKNIKESKEYKKIIDYKKSKEYREAKKTLKNLNPGSSEYEDIYKTKIYPVIEIEQRLQNQLNSIVCQYTEWTDFRKRILVPAQKTFLETIRDTDLLDMMFEYKPYSYKGKVIGIYFTIYTIEAYKKKEREQGVQISIFDYLKERNTGIATSDMEVYDEIGGADKVGGKPKRKKKKNEKIDITLNRLENYIKTISPDQKVDLSATEMFSLAKIADFDVIKEKYDLMIVQKNSIESPVAWLSAAIKGDFKENKPKAHNTFNRMLESEYSNKSNEELEKMMGIN